MFFVLGTCLVSLSNRTFLEPRRCGFGQTTPHPHASLIDTPCIGVMCSRKRFVASLCVGVPMLMLYVI
jgi:hypothetical protein